MFKHRVYGIMYDGVEWFVSSNFDMAGDFNPDVSVRLSEDERDIDLSYYLDESVLEILTSWACQRAREDETLRMN